RRAVPRRELLPLWGQRSGECRKRGGSYKRLHFGQRLIEYRHRKIDVVARDGQRRRDAPHRATLRTPADVHAESEIQAPLRGERAQLVMRLARFAVLHQLDAAQKTDAAEIADLFVALLQRLEAGGEIVAHFATARQQLFLLDCFDYREPDGRGQRIGDVRRIETETATMTLVLDFIG